MCCDKCDNWIQKTCASISDKKCKDMQENKPCQEIWLCIGSLTFPSQILIIKIYSFYMKMKTTLLLTMTLLNLVFIYCSIYLRKLGKSLKGIPCNCCKSFVHRRCSKLKLSEIGHLSKTKKYLWECHYCKKGKVFFCGFRL